jgi:hypothetical protein
MGPESSEIPEVAARLFLELLPTGTSAHDFAREQARMALDVFISEMERWSWVEDRYTRPSVALSQRPRLFDCG